MGSDAQASPDKKALRPRARSASLRRPRPLSGVRASGQFLLRGPPRRGPPRPLFPGVVAPFRVRHSAPPPVRSLSASHGSAWPGAGLPAPGSPCPLALAQDRSGSRGARVRARTALLSDVDLPPGSLRCLARSVRWPWPPSLASPASPGRSSAPPPLRSVPALRSASTRNGPQLAPPPGAAPGRYAHSRRAALAGGLLPRLRSGWTSAPGSGAPPRPSRSTSPRSLRVVGRYLARAPIRSPIVRRTINGVLQWGV